MKIKLITITLCIFFNIFLSTLITLGLLFTQYYEYLISDLVSPGWKKWLVGVPLGVEIFLSISTKGLALAGLIYIFLRNKTSFSKIFIFSSLLFFTKEGVNNFNEIHFKRLWNLKKYLNYVERNPNREKSVSFQKVSSFTLDIMKAYKSYLNTIFNELSLYEISETATDVIIGNKKFKELEEYEATIHNLKNYLDKLITTEVQLKKFMNHFKDEKGFKEFLEDYTALPKCWRKIPPLCQEDIIEIWLETLNHHINWEHPLTLELLDLQYKLNERYLHTAQLLKDQFNHYTIIEQDIIFEDEEIAKKYNEAIKDIQVLSEKIEDRNKDIDKVTQERREEAVKKMGAAEVETIIKYMES